MSCWVRSAIVTDSSVGSAYVSSSELVCSDWVPPSTAASACSAVRTTLLYGCCAVSDTPAVCACVRSCQRARVLRAEAVAHHAAPRCGARRGTWRSPRRSRCARPRRSESRGGEVVHVHAALHALLDVADAVGEREGQLLDRRRSGLADVVAADRDRVPLAACASCRTRSCPTTMRTAGRGATIHSFCAMYSLSMSFWMVPAELRHRNALLLAHRDVHAQRHDRAAR